jgi:hypothetical protein
MQGLSKDMVNNKFRIWPSDLGALRRYKSLMWLGHTARFAPSMASLTLTAKCGTYC